MNRVVIAGNWKMHKTIDEAVQFVEELKKEDLGTEVEAHLYVPAVYLDRLSNLVKGSNIVVGAQNVHQELKGAFTGEIAISMLESVNIKNTLVGHSERRQYFNETDVIVNQKTILCLENGISPVVCVGETLEERDAKVTNQVLKDQTTKALKGVSETDMEKVIIAYEPVWAIGTGKTSTPEDANDACKYIREVVKDIYNEEIANNLVIQYGGSVKPDNVKEILAQSDINGALVGGASLEKDSFVQLIK